MFSLVTATCHAQYILRTDVDSIQYLDWIQQETAGRQEHKAGALNIKFTMYSALLLFVCYSPFLTLVSLHDTPPLFPPGNTLTHSLV